MPLLSENIRERPHRGPIYLLQAPIIASQAGRGLFVFIQCTLGEAAKKAGPLGKRTFFHFFPIDEHIYFTLSLLRSCEMMLSVGKVVVFFSRFVAIFGKKYGSFSPNIFFVIMRFRLFYN